MAENGTIFKTRTYDFFLSYNKLKHHQKSKCVHIEVYTCVLLAPEVYDFYKVFIKFGCIFNAHKTIHR